MHIQIDRLTKAQELALEDMLKTWASLGLAGMSRWTCFYADGDGDFHPHVTIDGRAPAYCDLVPAVEKIRSVLVGDPCQGADYAMDPDWIAWKLKEEVIFA